MSYHLHRDFGCAIGVTIAITSDPGSKFDGCGIDWELFAECDTTLSIEFAKVGRHGVPEDGFNDGTSSSCFLLNSGFDTTDVYS
jgi:hypothetical protein